MEPVEPPVKPTSTDTAPIQAPAKPSTKERFNVLLRDYGPVAFGVYFSIFFLCILAFSVAIQAGLGESLARRFGVQLDGAGSLGATLFGAWVVTKAIQIPRIFATLALTPLVGRVPFVARFVRRSQESKG
jgi:hypothetical protein